MLQFVCVVQYKLLRCNNDRMNSTQDVSSPQKWPSFFCTAFVFRHLIQAECCARACARQCDSAQVMI